ncbi:acetylserotonin O-methyltransferase-like [Saccoglossus kowalevskii]|uniref:Acetylserotonin O-methyltransferase n=1 Tax=Saccoglossus kowalevskii TaxID=10224 RepID=A0ABM0MUM4_SACKO|nr:PREDICTED: N-acetylserotonin O-methyltransferase-like protein-like [Saccoglossus kowalevskii]
MASNLYNLLMSYTKTQVCFTAIELTLFDILEGGPRSVKQVLEMVEADADRIECILNACVGMGLLEKIHMANVDGDCLFRNTPVSKKYLTSSSPLSMLPIFNGASRIDYQLVGNLTHAVREGKSQIPRVYGSRNYFDELYRDPNEMKAFMAEMHSTITVLMRELVTLFDLSHYTNACDVGGCTGALAYAFAAKYPKMTLAVLDIPDVIALAGHFTPIDPKSERVTFIACDFFAGPFPNSDLFVLSNILHDWSDDRIGGILTKAYNALDSGGAILIIEALYDDDKTGPITTTALCMVMMATFDGGKQRSAHEITQLLEKHGFVDVQVKRSGIVHDAILAKKM